MVRIAGVDREISEVELILTQMDIEEVLTEVASWLANTHSVRIKRDFNLNLELDGGKKFRISVEEVK